MLFLGQTLARAEPPPFAAGETVHYKIAQMGLKVGEATLEYVGPKIVSGRNVVLIIFTSKGVNFYDQEKIYLDPESFRPLAVSRDLNIFGKKEKIIEYYVGQKIRIIKQVGKERSEQVLATKGQVDNIYGFIYRYRIQGPFKVGEQLDIRLPTKDLKISVAKETKLAAGGRTYDCYYMESEPAQYKIWFDKGPKKLPLRISGSIGVGNTAMIMTGVKD